MLQEKLHVKRFERNAIAITVTPPGEEILRDWFRGQFEIHFPKRFTLVMKALALLPAALYFPGIRKFTGL